jgi:hypothetical protein
MLAFGQAGTTGSAVPELPSWVRVWKNDLPTSSHVKPESSSKLKGPGVLTIVICCHRQLKQLVTLHIVFFLVSCSGECEDRAWPPLEARHFPLSVHAVF